MSSGVLTVRGLTKSYGEAPVLDSVSFEVDAGQVFALCGSSGAGKTTTVRVLSGLLGFESGELLLAGTRVTAGAQYPKSLYGRVGVIFQEFNLFPHLTVLNNVRLALSRVRKFDRERATECALEELNRIGLADKAKRLPAQLSSGERQRVAIARALALDPALLLMDEPTSSLHPRAVREAGRVIGELGERGTTMILVTHNVPFAQMVGDRFGLLAGGKLTVDDDPELLRGLEEPA
jgi:ABC-type polar amino acid transport system ATPase subunit